MLWEQELRNLECKTEKKRAIKKLNYKRGFKNKNKCLNYKFN